LITFGETKTQSLFYSKSMIKDMFKAIPAVVLKIDFIPRILEVHKWP
jgi:hypothetical protein